MTSLDTVHLSYAQQVSCFLQVGAKTDSRVKVLRSDNYGEYKSDKFVEFCANRDIVQKFMIPYTSELNGVAERMNQI